MKHIANRWVFALLIFSSSTSIFCDDRGKTDKSCGQREIPDIPKDVANVQNLLNDISSKHASALTFNRLKKHRNAELAFYAAWQEVSQKSDVAPKYDRFIGFVDGRLPVYLPHWWTEILSHAKRRDIDDFYFPRGDIWLYERKSGSRLLSKKNVRPQAINSELVGNYDGQQFRITKDTLTEAKSISFVDIIVPTATNDEMYVILASLTSMSSSLVKLDIHTGKQVWATKVCADFEYSSSGGRSYHFVEPIVGLDGEVYVFGIHPSCVYLESFSAEKGTPRFRFRTNMRPTDFCREKN